MKCQTQTKRPPKKVLAAVSLNKGPEIVHLGTFGFSSAQARGNVLRKDRRGRSVVDHAKSTAVRELLQREADAGPGGKRGMGESQKPWKLKICFIEKYDMTYMDTFKVLKLNSMGIVFRFVLQWPYLEESEAYI